MRSCEQQVNFVNNYEKHVGDKNLDYFLTNIGEVTETFSQCMTCHGDEYTLTSSNDSNCSCSLVSVPLLDYQEGLIRISSKESITHQQFWMLLSNKLNDYLKQSFKTLNI
jgi:hypothetical protein